MNVSWKYAQYNLFHKRESNPFPWAARWISYASKNYTEEDGIRYRLPLGGKMYLELFHLWGDGPQQFEEYNNLVREELFKLNPDAVAYLDECLNGISKYHKNWI